MRSSLKYFLENRGYWHFGVSRDSVNALYELFVSRYGMEIEFDQLHRTEAEGDLPITLVEHNAF